MFIGKSHSCSVNALCTNTDGGMLFFSQFKSNMTIWYIMKRKLLSSVQWIRAWWWYVSKPTYTFASPCLYACLSYRIFITIFHNFIKFIMFLTVSAERRRRKTNTSKSETMKILNYIFMYCFNSHKDSMNLHYLKTSINIGHQLKK